MTDLNLDASDWATALDFYDALLDLLKAPDWHGRNINALIDSMVHGDINQIEPPYRITVQSLSKASIESREELYTAFGFLAEEGALLTVERSCVTLQIGDLK